VHIPVRTCISCGKKLPKYELSRLVLDGESHLIRDTKGDIQGRGTYICKYYACQKRLKTYRHLNRIFRVEGNIVLTPDLETLL
jgi:predicted RNA-binding protein YlxR (DUF448 family)